MFSGTARTPKQAVSQFVDRAYTRTHTHKHAHARTALNADPVAVTSRGGLGCAGICVVAEGASRVYLEMNI